MRSSIHGDPALEAATHPADRRTGHAGDGNTKCGNASGQQRSRQWHPVLDGHAISVNHYLDIVRHGSELDRLVPRRHCPAGRERGYVNCWSATQDPIGDQLPGAECHGDAQSLVTGGNP